MRRTGPGRCRRRRRAPTSVGAHQDRVTARTPMTTAATTSTISQVATSQAAADDQAGEREQARAGRGGAQGRAERRRGGRGGCAAGGRSCRRPQEPQPAVDDRVRRASRGTPASPARRSALTVCSASASCAGRVGPDHGPGLGVVGDVGEGGAGAARRAGRAPRARSRRPRRWSAGGARPRRASTSPCTAVRGASRSIVRSSSGAAGAGPGAVVHEGERVRRRRPSRSAAHQPDRVAAVEHGERHRRGERDRPLQAGRRGRAGRAAPRRGASRRARRTAP